MASSAVCHPRARLCWLIALLLLSVVAIHQKQVLSVPKHKEAVTDVSGLFSKYHATLRDKHPPTQQVNRSVLSSSHHSVLDSKGGFVMAYHYWEQLTSSSKNLLHLQCWAGKLNMSVLEPSIRGSFFGADYMAPTTRISLRDLYDIDDWTILSHNQMLVSWSRFLEAAPRSLIRVNVLYAKYKNQKMPECTFRPYPLLEYMKFRTVREVCITFSGPKESCSLSEFNEMVFGEYSPSRSTVMFEVWRGFGRYRVQVRDPGCGDFDPAIRYRIHPSSRIMSDAEKYRARFLKASDYVAVMARMEKALRVDRNSTDCFQKTLSMWKKMVATSGIRNTFLSADIGRFGSASFSSTKEGLRSDFHDFLTTLYGHPVKVSQWESTFQAVSGVSNAAYISVLQKALAARAKCLLLVGGGNYQQHALQLYLNGHAEEERCVYIVESCTNQQLQYNI